MFDFSRDIYKELLTWKKDKNNKVLEVSGARQVGKTYILKKFAKENFTHFIYINMAEETGKEFLQCVEAAEKWEIGQKRPEKPLYDAIKLYDVDFMDDENTLIMIDEIQESSLVYNKIRTFAREFKSYVVVTGSYLGRTYEKEFFLPAGDIYNITLNTLSFEEFLDIFDKRSMLKELDFFGESDHKYYDEIRGYYELYLQIGGYPAVVKRYLETKSVEAIFPEIGNIIQIFIQESQRYLGDVKDMNIFEQLLPAVAQTMIKEKKGNSDLITELSSIIYKEESNRVTKRNINQAIAWLYRSNVIGYCGKANECNILDTSSNVRFYFQDVGVARYFLNIAGADRATIRGILAETFVYRYLQELCNSYKIAGISPLFGVYKEGEIDFFVNNRENYKNFGIEVKAGNTSEKTAELLLRDKKVDGIYMLKGDTYGGIHEQMYTIPIYLTSRLQFDGEHENI